MIEFPLPDIETRIEFLKIGLNNICDSFKHFTSKNQNPNFSYFNKKFTKKFLKFLEKRELGEIIDIQGLNYFELAKLTVGYNLREIKNILISIFEYFYINSECDTELKININLFKKILHNLKESRLKKEKTISSIPEVKWQDVGGLEHAKEDINDTINLPLKYPKLFESK